ncbi:MAG: HAD family hydrolase [Lachnospiraceae bacterium]|nr:HAD family hydrolase [Lachnospiraceae bacterium]
MNLMFDVDGTLWNTTDEVAEAWNDATEDVGLGREMGRFVTGSALRREFGKPMDEIIKDLYPDHFETMCDEILAAVRIREKAAVERCTTALAYPGVTDTMKELSRDHRLYIVSNCQEGYIPLVTKTLGITDCITDFESFGKTGLLKADNIRLVCERNGFTPEEGYYIGDTTGDYNSSTEAGMPFIYARYGFGPDLPVPDFKGPVIERFADLIAFTRNRT